MPRLEATRVKDSSRCHTVNCAYHPLSLESDGNASQYVEDPVPLNSFTLGGPESKIGMYAMLAWPKCFTSLASRAQCSTTVQSMVTLIAIATGNYHWTYYRADLFLPSRRPYHSPRVNAGGVLNPRKSDSSLPSSSIQYLPCPPSFSIRIVAKHLPIGVSGEECPWSADIQFDGSRK